MTFTQITYDVDESAAIITLHRPESADLPPTYLWWEDPEY